MGFSPSQLCMSSITQITPPPFFVQIYFSEEGLQFDNCFSEGCGDVQQRLYSKQKQINKNRRDFRIPEIRLHQAGKSYVHLQSIGCDYTGNLIWFTACIMAEFTVSDHKGCRLTQEFSVLTHCDAIHIWALTCSHLLDFLPLVPPLLILLCFAVKPLGFERVVQGSRRGSSIPKFFLRGTETSHISFCLGCFCFTYNFLKKFSPGGDLMLK